MSYSLVPKAPGARRPRAGRSAGHRPGQPRATAAERGGKREFSMRMRAALPIGLRPTSWEAGSRKFGHVWVASARRESGVPIAVPVREQKSGCQMFSAPLNRLALRRVWPGTIYAPLHPCPLLPAFAVVGGRTSTSHRRAMTLSGRARPRRTSSGTNGPFATLAGAFKAARAAHQTGRANRSPSSWEPCALN